MNVTVFIFILILVCVVIVFYFKLSHPNMTYVKSDIDDQFYLVRNDPDKQEAANTLAKLRNNFIDLSEKLYQDIDLPQNAEFKEYIIRLHNRAKNIIILESTKDSIYTSYSINKGEQIVFCLRKRTFPSGLHDVNLMMYVVLHEISHVACPIYDNHGPLFRKIFNFITLNAIKYGMYKKIDFRNRPENYCGLMITDSIV